MILLKLKFSCKVHQINFLQWLPITIRIKFPVSCRTVTPSPPFLPISTDLQLLALLSFRGAEHTPAAHPLSGALLPVTHMAGSLPSSSPCPAVTSQRGLHWPPHLHQPYPHPTLSLNPVFLFKNNSYHHLIFIIKCVNCPFLSLECEILFWALISPVIGTYPAHNKHSINTYEVNVWVNNWICWL